MNDPIIHKYGYEDGKRGLEAEYCRKGNDLFIKIFGSNHWTDYLFNFFAWPRQTVLSSSFKVHRVWWQMASAFSSYLREEFGDMSGMRIRIAAHSMGGPVALYLRMFIIADIEVLTVNAPKAGNRRFNSFLKNIVKHTAYYDAGDVVRFLPLFYSKYTNRREYGRTWPFWKAHNNKPVWWASFPDKVVLK